MKKLVIILTIAALSGMTMAVSTTINFDQAPGSEWYKDRYAPAVFQQTMFDGDNRLQLGLRAADNEAGRAGGAYSSNFYNYQGYKIDTPDNPTGTYISVDMYADSTWNAGVRAGMWSTASNGNLSYPIIEFCVSGDNSAYGGSSDFTGFRWWQSGIGWSDGIAMSADDQWHNLKIVMGSNNVYFYVDGVMFGQAGTNGADSIDNVILQGHNQGLAGEYDIYYDNLTLGAVVPVPGAFLLGSLGVGCVSYLKRRRSL